MIDKFNFKYMIIVKVNPPTISSVRFKQEAVPIIIRTASYLILDHVSNNGYHGKSISNRQVPPSLACTVDDTPIGWNQVVPCLKGNGEPSG